ncbi:MAG: hypothetical protein JW860_01925, partial [Sedimentisphaerales bacterium]|nr:hypothetical protein [Sedimentisphaerales bacterium]
MHQLFLALRFLCKRRIAFFGIGAVALCVALLIVITSLFTGFLDSFHTSWQSKMGQVILEPYRPLYQWPALAAHIESLDDVADATAVVETGGLLYLGRGDLRAVNLVGIDLDTWSEDDTIKQGLLLYNQQNKPLSFELSDSQQQRARLVLEKKLRRAVTDKDMPVGAILGIGLLGEPDDLTDEYDQTAIIEYLRNLDRPMTIIIGKATQPAGDNVTGSIKKMTRTCWPVEVVQTGMYDADTQQVYLPFDYVRQLTGSPDENGQILCAGRIKIVGDKGVDQAALIEKVQQAWVEFALMELKWPGEKIISVNISASMEAPHVKMLTAEIRKQLFILQGILGLICLVAALLVFVILQMIVIQKIKDIGIIRALGSSRWSVAQVFLWWAGFIGVAGAGLGLLLGVWATHHI